MLYEFIDTNRDLIVERTRQRIQGRPWPTTSSQELAQGVPQFLTQIVEILQMTPTAKPAAQDAVSVTASRHGAELSKLGYSVSQVVHDYGDICQVVTELAVEQNAPITVDEFQTLNLCLDIAIAGAVTEHARLATLTPSEGEIARLGHSAHELRDVLNTALLAFQALKQGTVAISGSTGAILGRSLMSLRDMIDRAVAEVRLTAAKPMHDRVMVAGFLDEIAATGRLHSEYRNIQFTMEPVDPGWAVDADRQLLSSAVMNLLHNAFKNTAAGGHVVLCTRAVGQQLLIEIEDECGGIPASKGDLFQAFGDRRGVDRSGLGLGLSIARRAVLAHGGDITIRNMPPKGCAFVIEMPMAATDVPAPEPVVQAGA